MTQTLNKTLEPLMQRQKNINNGTLCKKYGKNAKKYSYKQKTKEFLNKK